MLLVGSQLYIHRNCRDQDASGACLREANVSFVSWLVLYDQRAIKASVLPFKDKRNMEERCTDLRFRFRGISPEPQTMTYVYVYVCIYVCIHMCVK